MQPQAGQMLRDSKMLMVFHEQWMNATRPSHGGNEQMSKYRKENLSNYLTSEMEIKTKRKSMLMAVFLLLQGLHLKF